MALISSDCAQKEIQRDLGEYATPERRKGKDKFSEPQVRDVKHCLCLAFPLPLWRRQFLCLAFPLPSWPRQFLCLVCSTAFVAETLPVPCISTAFVAKTLSLSCVSTAVYYRPLPTTAVHCHSYTFFSTFHCLDDPPQRSTTTPT